MEVTVYDYISNSLRDVHFFCHVLPKALQILSERMSQIKSTSVYFENKSMMRILKFGLFFGCFTVNQFDRPYNIEYDHVIFVFWLKLAVWYTFIYLMICLSLTFDAFFVNLTNYTPTLSYFEISFDCFYEDMHPDVLNHYVGFL